MDSKAFFDSYRITLVGDVDGNMVTKYDEQVQKYFDQDEVLRPGLVVELSTPGGNTSVSRILHERLRLLPEVAGLTMVAVGECLSSGVTLMMAVARERRFRTSQSVFLVHQGAFSKSYELPSGTDQIRDLQVEELNAAHKRWRQQSEWVYQTVADGCGKTLEEVRGVLVPGREFTAEEAVDFGIVGGIIV